MSEEAIRGIFSVIGFVVVFFLTCFRSKLSVRNAKKENYKVIGVRLEHYAFMKGQVDGVFRGGLLKPCQHEILLGILKKIEAKSAVMSAIIIFALATAINSNDIFIHVSAEMESAQRFAAGFYFLALGMLLGLMPANLRGVNHIDQHGFLKIYEDCDKKFAAQRKNMQHALLDDLVRKETTFRLSVFVLVIAAVFFIFSISLRIPEVRTIFWSE